MADGRARDGAVLVAGGIALSRVAGLVREGVIGAYLGTTVAADAFRAALRIPNLLQNLLGEGVLSASFIPVYARLIEDGKDEEAGDVAGAVAGLLAVLAGVLVVVGVVLAGPITDVLAPGFAGPGRDLTVTLVRIMTPGIGVLVLSAWCLGVLNSHRRFFVSYVAPVLWSVAQIAAVVAVGLATSNTARLAEAVAWGVLAGGVLQLGVQLPAVRAVGGRIRVSLRRDLDGVRQAAARFGPVVAGRGVVQIAGYVDLLLASLLAVGAVSALGYAQVLYLLPISLFGMSVAAAELPELARAADDPEEQRARIEAGLARVAFYVAPIAAVYVVAGDVIVGALLQRGEFTPQDTRLVWFVTAAYAIGLLATTASRLLQNALYAAGDTRRPAVIAGARVALAAVVGVVLMLQLDRIAIIGPSFLQIGDLPAFDPLPDDLRREGFTRHLGAVGLAVGSGLAAWLEFVLLRRAVRSRFGPVGLGGRVLGPTLMAAGAAGIVAFALRRLLVASADLSPLAAAVPVLLPAAVVYLGVARLVGLPEARALVGRIGVDRAG